MRFQLHVYQVSPVLTIIEKTTARTFASLFGLNGPHAGGTTQPGGSASNTTALVVARNTMFPETKVHGWIGKRFVLFTSAHGHYSLEKAAQICGLGSANAWAVPVDARGRMQVSELLRLIRQAREEGLTPFFVNATAGTTVFGAYDPLPEIAEVCRRENLWFHVDASWGGAAIFSAKQRHKLRGSECADSLTVNPHKMMGVPLTCSFLLAADIRKFWRANTLPAGYLFHGDIEDGCHNGTEGSEHEDSLRDQDVWDLGDLTLQCGRRGDSLKLALGWIYYGSSGYEAQINDAFDTAAHLATLIHTHPDLTLLSENPPPCLQVCFYFGGHRLLAEEKERNGWRTKEIARRLVPRGFMVDYAPGEFGLFFRAVVHLNTTYTTVEGLVETVVEEGGRLKVD
jgi:glutamate decarboxylase